MIESSIYSSNSPPAIDAVRIYFSQKGLSAGDAEQFFAVYERKQWKNDNGKLFPNWKKLAHRWVMNIFLIRPWLFDKRIH